MTSFLKTTNPDELWNVIRAIQADIDALKLRDVRFTSLSEATDINDLDLRVITTDGTVRGVMSAINLYDEFGVSAFLLGRAPDGTPTFWADFDTGVLYVTSVNFNGSTLNEALVSLLQEGWIIYQQMTVGSETRVLRMGLQDNTGVIEFYEPSTPVTIPNGGFEDGDLSDWTVGSDAGGWSVNTSIVHGGMYSAKGVPYLGGTNIESAARFAVTAGANYNFSLFNYIVNRSHGTFTLTATAKFYDAPTGGTLLATETIGARAISTASGLWAEISKTINMPTGATHAVFRVVSSCTEPYGRSEFYLDDFSVTAVNGSELSFEDDGLRYTNSITGADVRLDRVRVFSDSTTTEGWDSNATTAATHTLEEGVFFLGRAIILQKILWDIYAAGTYVLTLRDFESNVLITLAGVVVSGTTADVEFDMSNVILPPGRYRVRITPETSKQFYYNTTTTELQRSNVTWPLQGLMVTAAVSNQKIPAKLVFYDETFQ